MKILLRAITLGFLSIAITAGASGVANASYNGDGAAGYADYYAYGNNSSYYYYGDDCTNFVSQAINQGGGKGFAAPAGAYGGISGNDAEWWNYRGGQGRTLSWSVAANLYDYLANHDPNSSNGYIQGSYAGPQGPYTPDAILNGDPIFYDWDTNANIQHSAIQDGLGTDPDSGWYGNLVAEHNNSRSQAIWNLRPYNSQWPTTTTYEVHIYG